MVLRTVGHLNFGVTAKPVLRFPAEKSNVCVRGVGYRESEKHNLSRAEKGGTKHKTLMELITGAFLTCGKSPNFV